MSIVYECGAGTVRLPIPPSVNNLFATIGRKRVTSRAYQEWQAVAIPLLRLMRKVKSYPVRAEIVVEETMRSNADLDNRIKGLLDSAKKAGVITDDSITAITGIDITYRPTDQGGVLLRFTELEG